MTDHSLHSTAASMPSSLPSSMPSTPKIAIIGGGLTGLFTATLLERACIQDPKQTYRQQPDKRSQPQITIFEKSRSVGRLATRYRTDSDTGKNWQWAFGAQFFTAKTSSFQQFIKPWLDAEMLQPWCAHVVDLTPAVQSAQPPDIQQKEQWHRAQARYISTPKMTSWGRSLAAELQHTTIHFKTHVAPLAQNAEHVTNTDAPNTELFDTDGNSLGRFDWVICTAPNGQAVTLMADSGFAEQAKIMQPQMQACYTLMLGWDEDAQLPEVLGQQAASPSPWDVAYLQDSILDRVFIEHQKPAHTELLPSITIHARNDWSEQHVDEDIASVQAQLWQAAQHALHWSKASPPSQIYCHRWRYAATVPAADNDTLGILVDDKHQWIVSGDWCDRGNIESCYQMAKQTAYVLTKAQ